MRRLVPLLRNRDGVAAVDFAFAAPILLVLVVGILQVGMVFQTNAGIRNAVEISARYATIYPSPTDAQIYAKLRANAFGLGSMPDSTGTTTGTGCKQYTGTSVGGAGNYTTTICRGTANGESYTEVGMVYPVRMNLLVYSGTFNLTYTRRAYQQ